MQSHEQQQQMGRLARGSRPMVDQGKQWRQVVVRRVVGGAFNRLVYSC